VVNSHLVCDRTIRQLGFDLPRQQWSLLNRFCMKQEHCGAYRRKWWLTDTDLCPCGETQTMSHIVESCPLTKLNGGLSRLHSADEDAVSWLTSGGSWHAYKNKKKCFDVVDQLEKQPFFFFFHYASCQVTASSSAECSWENQPVSLVNGMPVWSLHCTEHYYVITAIMPAITALCSSSCALVTVNNWQSSDIWHIPSSYLQLSDAVQILLKILNFTWLSVWL